MTNVTFYDRAETALNDQQLHVALNRTTSRFGSLRNNALANLPYANDVRDRARIIRAHTISKLADYLEQFAENVVKHGGQIHFAEDATQANQFVLEIAKHYNARTVVKGKSMVSEEMHLNHHLESAGMTVWESDLGERIVQEAGEAPSHIIAPAIHYTREQVGDLLHKKLGIPHSHEPSVIVGHVREKLRHEFLTADMGITGVNFGVAQTGTIALVENEGNGRLTSTAPRIHVALMGIERIVPSLDDLSVMLQVLARSATGQKLSVYTNLITGPRRKMQALDADTASTVTPVMEMDGPEHLHIIVVDNGRSKLLGSELAEILYCIRCGACLNACPVYGQIGGHAYGSVYPGPVGAVLTPGLEGIEKWSDLPHASSLCGACKEVCPVRIDIPRMLLKLRDEGHKKGKAPVWVKMGLPVYRFVAVRPGLFKTAIKLSQLGSRLISKNGWVTALPFPLSGWTQHRDFEQFAPKTFSQLFHEHKKNTPTN
jgi:L-lactate dehydrogenase complex protein LldF